MLRGLDARQWTCHRFFQSSQEANSGILQTRYHPPLQQQSKFEVDVRTSFYDNGIVHYFLSSIKSNVSMTLSCHNSSVMCTDTLLPIPSLVKWHSVLPKKGTRRDRKWYVVVGKNKRNQMSCLGKKRKVLYLTWRFVLITFPFRSHIPLFGERNTTRLVHCIKKCEHKSTHADDII